MTGERDMRDAAAKPDPVALVRDFLAAMEARDLDRARMVLADGFEMHFPSAPPMYRLEELVAWSKPRYRAVRKTYDGFDTAARDGTTIVYAFGTLHGEWLDGTRFAGIRFIDRFEIVDGSLTRQDVWNDMAETKART
jgi:hypothetical protein